MTTESILKKILGGEYGGPSISGGSKGVVYFVHLDRCSSKHDYFGEKQNVVWVNFGL